MTTIKDLNIFAREMAGKYPNLKEEIYDLIVDCITKWCYDYKDNMGIIANNVAENTVCLLFAYSNMIERVGSNLSAGQIHGTF